jgi:Ser/Thr protein kinase RdoA (MazF antagonist)
VELLHHLKNKDIPVSTPIVKMDGDYWFIINAPEGKRFAVLFTFAEGSFSETEGSAILYGREVANMHLAMDGFEPLHKRFTIDLDHLLDQPMKSISNALVHRPSDIKYLIALSDLLKHRVESICGDLEWGICHGDLHRENVHFSENDTMTHFDFDGGGYGWRAYDLAVYQWAKIRGKKKEEFESKLWDKYLHSYLEIKAISVSDQLAIPLFVAIREIWLMGLHTGNSHIWGNGWQNDRYFNMNLQFLRDWCEIHSIN